MSGTSLDGVDGVLLECGTSPAAFKVHAAASADLPDALRQALLSLNQSGPDELHRAAVASSQLAELYAEVVAQLLQRSGLAAAQIRAAAAAVQGHATLFRAGADGAPGVRRFDTESPALQTITKRLREAFDPHGIFNPGRMG